jgi:hypothetical protein
VFPVEKGSEGDHTGPKGMRLKDILMAEERRAGCNWQGEK